MHNDLQRGRVQSAVGASCEQAALRLAGRAVRCSIVKNWLARRWSSHKGDILKSVTVGQYAGVELQDTADTTRHGGIFPLKKPPHCDDAVSLNGWTTQLKTGTKAVVTFGAGQSTDAAGTFNEALEAANNGLDYMSARVSADVAIQSPRDDSIVWWPEGQGVVMQAMGVWATRIGLTATATARDASGNVIPSPPLTPIQHDALRFIRMSRTSDYLYDSYRNMFLALESLLADVAPQQPREREAAWFTRALAEADTRNLAPAADLAPPNETDPFTWAYQNIYGPKRGDV
jgi:hypothetical protein